MSEQGDKASLEADHAHEHDIAALMRQQLRDNISLETITAEEAEEELEEYDYWEDEWYGSEEEWED